MSPDLSEMLVQIIVVINKHNSNIICLWQSSTEHGLSPTNRCTDERPQEFLQGGDIRYPSLFFPYPSPFFSFSPISLFSSLHPAFPPRPDAKRPLKSRYRGHGIALSSASGGRAGASGVRGGGPAATASRYILSPQTCLVATIFVFCFMWLWTKTM